MHLGLALIRGSHPMKAAGLIERHPRTRFLLMHLAYPWSRDLLAMAFTYRNIWLDLTWAQLISPSHFKLALHEAIEVLPDESRLMIGGDNWHVEETCGAIKLMRQLIAEVLEEKVAAGYFGREDANAAGAEDPARERHPLLRARVSTASDRRRPREGAALRKPQPIAALRILPAKASPA